MCVHGVSVLSDPVTSSILSLLPPFWRQGAERCSEPSTNHMSSQVAEAFESTNTDIRMTLTRVRGINTALNGW
jgi:hypothetical protein